MGINYIVASVQKEKNPVFPVYSLLYTDAGRVRASRVTSFAFEGTVQNVAENPGAGARLACRWITRPRRMVVVVVVVVEGEEDEDEGKVHSSSSEWTETASPL